MPASQVSASQEWVAALPESFRNWLDGRAVEEVECIVPDIAGVSRGKAMPAAKFARALLGDGQKGGDKPGRSGGAYLPSSIFYQTITGGYADLDIRDQYVESDLVLAPDLATATAAPWTDDVVLQVVHDLFTTDGRPAGVAPRAVLKRVLTLFELKGWRPVIAPEMEFYLTAPNTDPNEPIAPPIGRTGRRGIGRQSYSMAAVDEYGKVIDDIYDFAEAHGFGIDTVIQEGGAGQIEINLAHGDPLALADQVFYFKRSIREAALRNGCFATFMAKPMKDEPGSAMHMHHSVVDRKTGGNIFSTAAGEPSPEFYYFIGGLQKHLHAVLPILAPYVNSYRRFQAGDSAPANVEWAPDNRTTGLRAPISDAANRRVENRIAGMDCNPYLAFAASLACGYLGLTNRIDARAPRPGDAYADGMSLPPGLLEALNIFQADSAIRDILGAEFSMVYAGIKHKELEEFLSEISPWERQHLLLNV